MILGKKKKIVDAINENEENLTLKMSIISDEINTNFNAKFKKISEKIDKALDKVDTDKEKYEQRIKELEKQLAAANKREQETRSKLGGVSNARKKESENYEKAMSEATVENTKLSYDLSEARNTISEQNDLLQKLTSELNEEKNKKPAPTIEELEKDKIFHGKRNDRKKKQCKH